MSGTVHPLLDECLGNGPGIPTDTVDGDIFTDDKIGQSGVVHSITGVPPCCDR